MTPEEWQKVRPILESALELDPESRPAFVNSAFADPSLRREVESLIAAHEQAGTNALRPGPRAELKLDEEAQFRLLPGKRIGAYEILEEIAVGGMGAVYRAIRADGQYRQQVALKIVRSELGAEATATRFRNERQILASLDHPNIAKILDGGSTADGLPYFAMEFIDGLPITEYCDAHRLSVDARLKIFRIVCSAVHYAHQHLVIHRDIKPTNILVTSDGVAKLLDFGIAKILDPTFLQENIAVTLAGLWVMTPEYASPEQLRGEAITTASDVYSLGLVLYELLTGHRAYRFPSHLPHEIARAVLETDPEKPSTAIRRQDEIAHEGKEKVPLTPELISSLRADSPEKLRQRINGDLDNIVLKAIRKEPRDRYSSADQLSEDIRRHLEHLPVLARKSTVAYRCKKYVLRHKIGVAAAALVFLSLLTGIALTLREARIARANELRAERRFNDVRKLANSLMFEINDSIRQSGATAARKLIIQRAQEYLDSLAQESKSDPALARELATAYTRLGDVLGNPQDANIGNLEESLRNYRRAVELREAAVSLAPSDLESRRELAESYMSLALALRLKKQGNNQGDFLAKALSILEQLDAANPANPKIEYDLALAWQRRGQELGADRKWPEARSDYRKSLEILQRLATEDSKSNLYLSGVASTHKLMGGTLILEKQFQPALEEYRAALSIEEKGIEAEPQNSRKRYDITMTYSDIAMILGRQNDIDGALASYRKVLDIRKELATTDPADTRVRGGLAMTYNFIARLRWIKGDLQEALKDEQQAFSIRQVLWQGDPTNLIRRRDVAFAQGSIGETYVKMAFQPRTTSQQKLALCRQAETWLQKALPEFRVVKDVLGGDIEYPAMVQQAADRCRPVIAGSGGQNQSPIPARVP